MRRSPKGNASEGPRSKPCHVWIWLLIGAGLWALATSASASAPTADVRRALATIRAIESGGNYRAQNPTSSASGAYQFLDSTWNRYGGYSRAKDAPPNVQDEKAAAMVVAIQRRFGLDPKWIPASWYAGMAGAASKDWSTVLPGNRSSIAQYVNKWLATYEKIA